MVLINIVNPSYIKQVLEGEVLREMRELISGPGELDVQVRSHVADLFQVIDTIEMVRIHGEDLPPVDVKWKIENYRDHHGNPFQSEAMRECAAGRDRDPEGFVQSMDIRRDEVMGKGATARLLKEYDENMEEIVDHNKVETKSLYTFYDDKGRGTELTDGYGIAIRLTRDNLFLIGNTFPEVSKQSIAAGMRAPSATPAWFIMLGNGSWFIEKPREFNRQYNILETNEHGLVLVKEKDAQGKTSAHTQK